jgi:hypothetical protein
MRMPNSDDLAGKYHWNGKLKTLLFYYKDTIYLTKEDIRINSK